MATAQTLINAALRKIGVIAAGESPSGDESNDALDTLNRMLESWRLERLSAFAITTTTNSWAAGTSSKTIGSSGTINTTRPVKIESATWTESDVVYPLDQLNAEDWHTLSPTGISGTPEYLYYATGYPLGTINIYPAPSANGTLSIMVRTPLSSLALGDTITLPPGYERALVYSLAVELASEYGFEAPATVIALARDSKADLKRANLKVPLLGYPDGLPKTYGPSDIFAGGD